MTFPRRSEIYLVDFDPTRGHEIKKTCPALIIQNDIGNRHSPITIVAAITSKPAKETVLPYRRPFVSTRSAPLIGNV